MKYSFIFLFALLITVSCGKKSSDGGGPGTVSIGDLSIAEGNGGTNVIELTLSLDKTVSKPVTMNVTTFDGTAKSGADFTAISGQSISFAAGEKEKKIAITVVADDIKEADETFQVQLQNPSNAILLKTTVVVTLRNDDTKVAFNNSGFDAPTTYPGYTLAWSDEFNGTSLANDAWSYESGDGCPALCSWGNNELQYYTAPPNNLFFQDGKMIIEAKSETFGGKNYTSSRIKTQSKKSFKFGRIDIRAILPKGRGLWPAFWMLPQNNVFGGWPRSGEIDLMETIGSEPGKTSGTVHFGPGPNSIYVSKTYTLPAGTFNDQFHVFSFEWKQDQMQWIVDGNVYATFTKADVGANNYPFNESFYFLINLAVGGNLPGPPDANTLFPEWLIVDYIRIYQ